MLATNRFRCRVIAIPVSSDPRNSTRDRLNQSGRSRPSELLPWADPYIAELVGKLQREVRRERAADSSADSQPPSSVTDSEDYSLTAFELEFAEPAGELTGEAEMPWNEDPYEYEPGDDESIPDFDDRRGNLSIVR